MSKPKTQNTIKIERSRLSGPPYDCPICGGQTEWAGSSGARSIAMCFFCDHVFESNTPEIDENTERLEDKK